MASSYENVIFPNAPMLLVHRDWRKTQKNPNISQISSTPASEASRSRKGQSRKQSTLQKSSNQPPSISVFKLESSPTSKTTVESEPERHSVDEKKKKEAKQIRRKQLTSSLRRPSHITKKEQTSITQNSNSEVSRPVLSQHPTESLMRFVPVSSQTANSIEMNHYLSFCMILSLLVV
jgi:hypothetical protein